MRQFLLLLMFVTLGYSAHYGTLLTASKTGTYFQIGNDIQTLFSKYGVKLNILDTKGSSQNLNILYGYEEIKGAHWAIIQKDSLNSFRSKQYSAANENIFDKIRIILPLYGEEIHIIAKKGSNILFERGANFIVNCGSMDSGSCISASFIEKSYNVNFTYDRTRIDEALTRLKEGKIHMIIRTIGKPFSKIVDESGIELVELPQNVILDNYYDRKKITKDDYKWIDKETLIYSCPSVIVTNLLDEKYNKVVKTFFKIIEKNITNLQTKGHPKWNDVDFLDDKKKYYHKALVDN